MAGAGAKAGGELPLGWSSEIAGGRPSPGGCDCAGGGVVDFFSSAESCSDVSRFSLCWLKGGLSIGAGAGLTAVLPSIGRDYGSFQSRKCLSSGPLQRLGSVLLCLVSKLSEQVALEKQHQTPPGTPFDPFRDASAPGAAGFWLLARATRTLASLSGFGAETAASRCAARLVLQPKDV